MTQDMQSNAMESSLTQSLFEAVVQKDYESLVHLYATNARNAVLSYLSMRRRWAPTSNDNNSRAGKHEFGDV